MISLGEAGGTFVIRDEASAVLRRIADQFEGLDRIIARTKQQLGELRLPPGLSASVNKLALNFDKITGAADKAVSGVDLGFKKIMGAADEASLGVGAAFAKIDAAIGVTETRLRGLTREMRGLHGPSIRDGGHGGGGGHGGLHFEPVGAFGGHVSQGSDGFWELIGGAALLEGAKKLAESGLEFRHWTAQMQGIGADQATIAAATAAAWKNAGVNMNTTAIEGAKQTIELLKATGSWDESMRLLPAFSVAQFAMQSVKDDGLHSNFNSGTQTLNFARGLEELGVTQMGKTPEERLANIQRYTAELTRTMIASRGLFDGNQFYGLTNNSGGAAQNWSERFATVTAPILSNIMKAGKMGNADYMALKSYAGGHITPDAVEALMKYGLTEPGDTYHNKSGWHLHPNSKFAEGMTQDPWEWSDKIIAKLSAAGVDPSDQQAMNKVINAIGSNKSTSMLMRLLLEPLSRQQILKEMGLVDKVPGDAATVLQQNDPTLKIAAFEDKLHDLMTALGGPLTDKAMAALDVMTRGLNSAAQFFNDHPGLATLSADLIGISGAFLVLSGAVTMLKLATSGLTLATLLGVGSGTATAAAGGAAGQGAVAGVAAGGLMGIFRKLGILGAVMALTMDADPGGDFGGFGPIKAIDEWAKKYLGFDPSNVHLGDTSTSPRIAPLPTGSGPRIPGFGRPANSLDAPNIYSAPAGPAQQVRATLQASVSTTVPFTVVIDGQTVANAIMPLITQKIEAEMHRSMNSGLSGMPNDVAVRMGPEGAN